MSDTNPTETATPAAKPRRSGKPARGRKTAKKANTPGAPVSEKLFFPRDESWMLFNYRVSRRRRTPAILCWSG